MKNIKRGAGAGKAKKLCFCGFSQSPKNPHRHSLGEPRKAKIELGTNNVYIDGKAYPIALIDAAPLMYEFIKKYYRLAVLPKKETDAILDKAEGV